MCQVNQLRNLLGHGESRHSSRAGKTRENETKLKRALSCCLIHTGYTLFLYCEKQCWGLAGNLAGLCWRDPSFEQLKVVVVVVRSFGQQ